MSVDRRFFGIEELHAAYADGSTRPTEVIESALQVAKTWEDTLNAFITLYDPAAILRVSGTPDGQGLLHGIPIALKDLVDVMGERTTSGSRIRKEFISDEDAPVWIRLKAAGARLLGKTNMLEFAYGVPHPDYGQTNNPYDAARTSGGSSGGSAAAVAVGSVVAAIGTDTGGSIRIPAAYCGVVGLKPTYGLVNAKGVFPLSWSLDHVGPIARSARDAAFMMAVIAGDGPFCGGSPLPSSPFGDELLQAAGTTRPGFIEAMANPSGVKRVGYLTDELLPYTHPDMRRAYHAALDTLAGQGLELVPLTDEQMDILTRAEAVLLNVLLAEAAEIHRPYWDRADDYAALTWQQIVDGKKVAGPDYLHGLAEQAEIRRVIERWFGSFDVLVTPTVDFPAPLEDPAIGDVEMDEMRYTGPFNVSGNPAVTLPCGLSTDGLPLGLQLVGPLFDDARMLRFAHEFETDHPRILRPKLPESR